MGGKGDGKRDSSERPRSRGRAKAKPQPAPKGRASSAPGRPKSKPRPQEEEKREQNQRPGRASSANSRPPPRRRVQPKLSWDHPEGRSLEELEEGATVTGVVVNVSVDHGVFIDIGYEQNVFLGISRRFWRRFRRGDIIEDLKVDRVDASLKRAVVTIEDVEASLIDSRIPLDEIRKGTYVNGVVDNKTNHGIFVNIGIAGGHGRLQVPRSLGMQLQRGQILRDLYIGTVDLELSRISLLLDDIEGAIEEMEIVSAQALLPDLVQSTQNPRERSPPAEARAKPKPKAKAAEAKKPSAAKAAKENKEPSAPNTKQVKDREKDVDVGVAVGDLVDGVVMKISARSVLVDIGGGVRCSLQVPSELRDEFRRGDRVQGMKVEKISSAGVITLSMDDPELEVVYQPSKNGSHDGKAESPKEKGKGKGKDKGKGQSKGNSRK